VQADKIYQHIPNHSIPARQRGLAVILVVLVIALVSVLVVGLQSKQYIDIRRTANILGQQQSVLYALAAESFARVILKDDWQNDRKDNAFVDHELDTEDEKWGQYAIQIPIESNVGIQGQIDDLTAKFNINSLVINDAESSIVNAQAVTRLNRLIGNLEGINADLVAEKFVDWLDRNVEIYELRGAEDETYLLADPPYRSANTLFNDISELWLIDGMTRDSYNELRSLLSVLPTSSASVNINTAGTEILRAYIPQLSAEEAQQIVSARAAAKGFKTLGEFFSLEALAGKKDISDDDFSLSSNYFQVIIRAVFNDRTTRLTSTIHRDAQGKTSVIKRDYASRDEITKQVFVGQSNE